MQLFCFLERLVKVKNDWKSFKNITVKNARKMRNFPRKRGKHDCSIRNILLSFQNVRVDNGPVICCKIKYFRLPTVLHIAQFGKYLLYTEAMQGTLHSCYSTISYFQITYYSYLYILVRVNFSIDRQPSNIGRNFVKGIGQPEKNVFSNMLEFQIDSIITLYQQYAFLYLFTYSKYSLLIYRYLILPLANLKKAKKIRLIHYPSASILMWLNDPL